MTQLIINNIPLPKSSNDRYKVELVELGSSMRMISGKLVSEIRGRYWEISYSYDKLPDDLMRRLLPILRSNDLLTVQFLTPDSDELMVDTFRCTKKPAPVFAFSVGGVGRWHNFNFTLEGVQVVA